MKHYDTIIAGSGIMGLSCALEEAKRNKNVLVIDNIAIGRKSSRAASGIVGFRGARKFFSVFKEFLVQSIGLYPGWLDEISVLAGSDIKWETHGDYQLYNIDDEDESLAMERELEKLAREEARDYELLTDVPDCLKPYSAPGSYKALYFPNDSYVDNRLLMIYLQLACLKSGATLEEDFHVREIRVNPGKVTVKYSQRMQPADEVSADHLLITSGAWCNTLLSLIGKQGPFVPVKGQIITIPKFYDGNAMIHWYKDLYMVPRGDILLIGSNVEPHVWDEDPDPAERENMQKLLKKRFPDIDVNPIREWAGIRPKTKDRLPLMGHLDDSGSISICSGHYKSGIMMAPLSARCMSALINGETSPAPPEEFTPYRKKGVK